MDEKDIIRYIRKLSGTLRHDNIELGPGDDAACIGIPPDGRIVVSTDMVVEGTHFMPDTPPEKVGEKAIGRALSDLAAMASRPLCSFAAICFPENKSDAYKKSLCRSLHENAGRFGAPLAGGDTGAGASSLVITVTVIGTPGAARMPLRKGARPGDSICVTGALGGSSSGRHLSPEPLIDQSIALAGGYAIHAMIDISDGLSTDLLHIANESGVGVLLDAAKIPIHPDAEKMAAAEGRGDAKGAVLHALGDGEDYELLFCLPAHEAENLVSGGIAGSKVSIIGCVRKEMKRTVLWPDGTETRLRDTGWRHLKSKQTGRCS